MNKTQPGPASPLFIVGSPRSGTSVLIDAAFAAGYKGFREGNLLGVLQPMLEKLNVHFRQFGTENPKVLIANVQMQTIQDAVLGIFKQAMDSLNPEAPWVDKTCNWPMIRVLPQVRILWPGSRILFARRRGIENVRSRLKKFPGRNFTYHCQDWALTMTAWREVREHLEPDCYIETDQRDLLLKPKMIAARIGELLSLDASAQARVKHALVTLRSQETAPGTADAVGSLEDGHWTPSEVDEFVRVCGAEMEHFGYTADASYCTSPAE